MKVFPDNADLSPPKRVKFGIDPTFPRLHLGHFVPLRLVKKMMREGHRCTIVLGTFTAQLGDPSGRDTTRPILSAQEVENNATAITRQIWQALGTDDICIFHNHRLHNFMCVPEFLKLASKFTLAHMTSRDAFAKRIEEGNSIALHELLVPICQGMDSVHLQAEIEIGGQDQLFNFQVARRLQQEQGQKPQANILLPIINGTDGRKMSKSLGNCIFLDEVPADIFGKVMSISDAVMEEWFPLFVDFTVSEDVHPMDKKKMLATEIVAQLHGVEAAFKAGENFLTTIQKKELPDDIPTISVSTALDAVVTMAGISRNAGRQLLRAGAVRIDGAKVTDEAHPVRPGQIVKCGKREFARIGNENTLSQT